MSRLIESNEASRTALQHLSQKQAVEALQKIHDLLWPRAAPWQLDWNGLVAAQIAETMRDTVRLAEELADDVEDTATQERA
jgi:hypothetical protein